VKKSLPYFPSPHVRRISAASVERAGQTCFNAVAGGMLPTAFLDTETFEENQPVEDLIPLVSRWIHVGTSIVLVGGSVFLRFVLAPAAGSLPEAEHTLLRERVVGIWKRFVHVGILLFLLSGFYNYLVVTRPDHAGDSLYHALMGTKILLALVVFFIGSALVGKSAGLAKIREQRNTWLLVLVLLSAVIVGIGGFLKIRKYEPKAEAALPAITSNAVIG
jgi:uncharacterized membrane protein